MCGCVITQTLSSCFVGSCIKVTAGNLEMELWLLRSRTLTPPKGKMSPSPHAEFRPAEVLVGKKTNTAWKWPSKHTPVPQRMLYCVSSTRAFVPGSSTSTTSDPTLTVYYPFKRDELATGDKPDLPGLGAIAQGAMLTSLLGFFLVYV